MQEILLTLLPIAALRTNLYKPLQVSEGVYGERFTIIPDGAVILAETQSILNHPGKISTTVKIGA